MNPELGWRPGLHRMTILAAHAKNAGMNCRLCMALHTFRWGTMVYTIFVTAGALYLTMHPFQWKQLPVIKINHAVNSIMTIQASCTILINVCGQKSSPLLDARRMTVDAHL